MADLDIQRYFELGWSVFPVKGPHYGQDYEDQKRPVGIDAWGPYQFRKPNPDEIKVWLFARPKMSVAAVTGPISKFIVVDIDSEDWRAKFPDADFGESWKAITRNGCHYFYQWEDWMLDFPTTKTEIGGVKGLDLRGNGGYVVVPNKNDHSRHWQVSPWDHELEPMPDWLREFLQASLHHKKSVESKPVVPLKEISEGNRHASFLSYTGKLHRAGLEAKEIVEILLPAAESCGYEKDLQALVYDVVNRYPRPDETKPVMAVSSDEIHQKALDELKEKQEKGIEFHTHLYTLDEKLGGLRRRELVSIGAYTSHGKSLLAGTLAIRLASQGRVCYFTTEMNAVQFYTLRVAPFVYAISSSSLRHANLNTEEWGKLKNLPALNLWYCDLPSPTLAQIAEICMSIKPDIVIVDHLNRCRTEKAETRTQGIADFLIGIKTLALEQNMVSIVTAQLNRASQMGTSPGLFHFRDSGAIEMESDVAILLDKKDETGTKIDALIAKNRHGPKSAFDLTMDVERMVVVEL